MTLQKATPFLFIAALLLYVGFVLLDNAQNVRAESTQIPGRIATTSVNAVTSTQSLVFATSSCLARVISTTGVSGILIGFTDNQGFVPTATQGFWQAASTTVSYDAAQFGCGAVRIYSGINQNITVSDVR